MTDKLWILFFLSFAMLLTGIACNSMDCRHKVRECASGFSCEESVDGQWVCIRKAMDDNSDSETVQTEAPVKKRESVKAIPSQPSPLCMNHPLCADNSLECHCDAEGLLRRRVVDLNGDNKADEQAFYMYNREGFLTFVNVDKNMNGKIDQRHEYGYYGEGRPRFWKVQSRNSTEGPAHQSAVNYIYNGDNQLIEMQFDNNSDQKPDRTCVYSPPCPPPIPNRKCKSECTALGP